MLRQAFQLSRRSALRYNSTASKATEAASKATDKASEGASKVVPALSKVGNGLLKTLGSFGGRAAQLAGLIERSIPPTIYYARVGLELSKLVFQGRGLSFPSRKVWEQYYQQTLELVTKSVKDRKVIKQEATKIVGPPETLWSRVRGLNGAQLAGGAIVSVELLGLFTVGEIIGKRKLVGYRGPVESHH